MPFESCNTYLPIASMLIPRPATVEIFIRNLHPKSSAEIFIRAVLAIVLAIVSIKLVGPNTAVFGIIGCLLYGYIIPNTAVFGPTNFIGTTTIASTARMTVYALDEDFYGGRTGPLEKFYLFIYFLLIQFI